MNKTTGLLLSLMLIFANVGTGRAGTKVRERMLFDYGWTFTQNGRSVAVDLPHDWDIYAAPDPQTGGTGTGGGWYPGGKGEYQKTFDTPKGEAARLHFEGVYQKATVRLNGQVAGHHAYGYTPFSVDITPYLYRDGRENVVTVSVDNSEQPNCRWYSGSGIYRHVWLETYGGIHFVPDSGEGVGLRNTTFAPDGSVELEFVASIQTEGSLANEQSEGCVLKVRVDGIEEEINVSTAMMERHPQVSGTLRLRLPHPRLWSPASPTLYRAHLTLSTESGKLLDSMEVPFGVRRIEYDAREGLRLNGEPLLINGACVHHDDGVLGAMAFDAAEIRKVRQMKEAGFNLIRTSHNPTTRAFLDACDSLGMLVIDEAFDGWRSAKNPYDYSTLIDSCWKEDIRAMVLRDRNHPSVIAWSIGNEVIERKDIRVVTTARQLKNHILRYDPTRPVTEALCSWDNDWEIYDPHAEVLDIVGYNYMIHKHKGDHRRAPSRVIWQTESYPRDAFQNWANTQDYPYIVGDIVWTGLDYLGESGIGRTYYEGEREGEHYRDGGQPDWHGAYCGDVDLTGWRKPISHYRQTLWTEAPGLYMAVKEPSGYRGTIKETQWSVWPTWESWNWQGWEGKPIEVEVYTRHPQVSLYLNDRLIATRAVNRSTEYKAIFTLPYEPGTLRAVTDDGTETTLRTAGEPYRIRLTSDRTTLHADGQDLAFITLEVVDKAGNVVPEAAVSCDVKVKGAGQLMAFASADLKDREPTTSPHAVTWKGRALIVVRSGRKEGKILATVQSSLPASSVTLRTTRAH